LEIIFHVTAALLPLPRTFVKLLLCNTRNASAWWGAVNDRPDGYDYPVLEEKCTHRPVQYLNNVLEQDHRAIKCRVHSSQHFRSFWGAWRTIAGYEAIHMIRKGQAYGSAAGEKIGLLDRFILGLFAASNRIADHLRRFSPRLQTCNTA
jgi:hypothetical protein